MRDPIGLGPSCMRIGSAEEEACILMGNGFQDEAQHSICKFGATPHDFIDRVMAHRCFSPCVADDYLVFKGADDGSPHGQAAPTVVYRIGDNTGLRRTCTTDNTFPHGFKGRHVYGGDGKRRRWRKVTGDRRICRSRQKGGEEGSKCKFPRPDAGKGCRLTSTDRMVYCCHEPRGDAFGPKCPMHAESLHDMKGLVVEDRAVAHTRCVAEGNGGNRADECLIRCKESEDDRVRI